jgi:hypothetical protein
MGSEVFNDTGEHYSLPWSAGAAWRKLQKNHIFLTDSGATRADGAEPISENHTGFTGSQPLHLSKKKNAAGVQLERFDYAHPGMGAGAGRC